MRADLGVAGLDLARETQVLLRVFVAGEDLGVVRELRESEAERAMHHRRGSFEEPTAPRDEHGVAREHRAFVGDVSDRAERVGRHVEHSKRNARFDEARAVVDAMGDAFEVRRIPWVRVHANAILEAREQPGDTTDVIVVVMRAENRAQGEPEFLERGRDRTHFARIDDDRIGAVANDVRVIVREARDRNDLHRRCRHRTPILFQPTRFVPATRCSTNGP